VRSGCLKELTLARRPATQKEPAAGVTDALLAELSSASLLPFRDDRGVVVTLRALFNAKDELSHEASSTLDSLGKVAKAHPEFPVLAVVHAARGNANAHDASQAAAVADALRKAGAARVETDTRRQRAARFGSGAARRKPAQRARRSRVHRAFQLLRRAQGRTRSASHPHFTGDPRSALSLSRRSRVQSC